MNIEEFEKVFNAPFRRDGEPQKFLRMLMPFFEKDVARKEDMLKLMGVDIISDPKKRNTHSSTLAKLSKTGILQVKARGNGYWKRGPNWDTFFMWISLYMMKNPVTKNKFKDMLVKYENNGMDFIMKD